MPGLGQPVPPITSARAVHELSSESARANPPVRLRGVITYFQGHKRPSAILQDETSGIFIVHPGDGFPTALVPGQFVEIEGHTADGGYAPFVRVEHCVAGEMRGLPAPERTTLEDLLAGGKEAQYVELSGIVRSAVIEKRYPPDRLILNVGTPAGRIDVWMRNPEQANIAALQDAFVTVRGVCLHWVNQRREPFHLRLLVNGPEAIEILQPGPADPFAAPQKKLDDLLRFDPDRRSIQRTRVRGVVTMHRSSERLIVVQDASLALRVRTTLPANVLPGDEIEAAGFPSMGEYTGYLDDAVIRVLGHPGLPEPESLGAANVLPKKITDATSDRDGRLLQIEATLQSITPRLDRLVMEFADGPSEFSATLPIEANRAVDLQRGSRVRVTGICALHVSEGARFHGEPPDSFSLVLPTADAVEVLATPPWWTFGRMLVAAAISAVLGLMLYWAMILKRRVRLRTAQLAAEIRARHAAELLAAERQRLADDLHDTLEQTLTGAAFQLEAAEAFIPERSNGASEHLVLANRLLDRSRDELRRALWDLVPGAMEKDGLSLALQSAADDMAAASRCAFVVRVEGEEDCVPEDIARHLFRVAQESMANAIKHGKPSRVEVHLSISDSAIDLSIKDDGVGFDLQKAAGAEEGHFGLRSMHERLKRIGGRLHVSSGANGTTINARVPMAATV